VLKPASCGTLNCVPQYVHLAVTGNSNEIVVSWRTLGHPNTSTVYYGLQGQSSAFGKAIGTSISYTHADYDGDVVLWNHHTVVRGLKPNIFYWYQCGDQIGGFSPKYEFKTAPPAPQQWKYPYQVKVLVYGDMGIVASEKVIPKVNELATTRQIDFVWHVGDISYADDYPSGMYEQVWDLFFAMIEPATSHVPYMVLPGNHEENCQHVGCDYANNFTAYNYRFRMPGPESGGFMNMWYSFDYGNVHFISVSTETDFPNAPEPEKFGDQLTWLERDLKTANLRRKTHPWIIVGGHRPMYSTCLGFSQNGRPISDPANLQKAMEELFHTYHVDMFIVGHIHAYERTYPIYQNRSTSRHYDNPKSTVYMTVGTGGNVERRTTQWVPAEWSAFTYDKEWGYSIMSFSQSETQDILEWKFYGINKNQLVDSFALRKDRPDNNINS
jgi:hypothetical protein